MKKKPTRRRTASASAASPHFKSRSGSRVSGGRSRIERPPPLLIAVASNWRLERCRLQRAAVADEPAHLRLGLGEDRRRQRRVLQLRRDLLTAAERVVEPVHDPL